MKQFTASGGALRRHFEILLVEDSPSDVMLATVALDDAEIANHLHIVRDGVAAIAFLRGAAPHADAPRPDLIFLDLNLPRKDGREVLAEIKQDPALRSIPVVVLTTSKAEKDVAMSYDRHANCYITKPVDYDTFARAIRDCVQFWFSTVTLPPACEAQTELVAAYL